MVPIRPFLSPTPWERDFEERVGRVASEEAEEPAVEELVEEEGWLRGMRGSLEREPNREEKEVLVLVVLGA